jgi:hypothetical protein
VDTPAPMPDTLEELQALEREVEREWWWLNGALHAIAQVQAEGPPGSLKALRQMQAQARMVDQRWVQIAVRIAEIGARALDADDAISKDSATAHHLAQ